MTAENEGELEYGSILPNGEDWRLRKLDAGMGESEYWIFKNEKFFAQFDNRKDADAVMEAMLHPHNPQAEREKIADALKDFDMWFSMRHVCGQSPIIPEVRQELHRRMRELRQEGKDGE